MGEVALLQELDSVLVVGHDAEEFEGTVGRCPVPVGLAGWDMDHVAGLNLVDLFTDSYPGRALQHVLLVLHLVGVSGHPASWLHDEPPHVEAGSRSPVGKGLTLGAFAG
jgi:hypothetical protein